jgi:hypothetical protein
MQEQRKIKGENDTRLERQVKKNDKFCLGDIHRAYASQEKRDREKEQQVKMTLERRKDEIQGLIRALLNPDDA